MSASAADRVERRRHGRTGALDMWPVGSRELCRPRTEAEGKLVTESDLSLRAPAQVAADLYWNNRFGTVGWRRRMAFLSRWPQIPRCTDLAGKRGYRLARAGRRSLARSPDGA